jgi:hypothetical protein
MGRYYNGDVEGKFMFAVQSSNAHERFGAIEYEPNYINYTIDREKYDDIVKELNSIDKGSINRVTKMFEENNGYNDDTMKRYNVSVKDLSEYADFKLGEKVKDFFDDNPDMLECNFEAEL